MVLRKTTIENGVRCIPVTYKTKEADFKPQKNKLDRFLVNTIKIFHNDKKFLKNIAASGFGSNK